MRRFFIKRCLKAALVLMILSSCLMPVLSAAETKSSPNSPNIHQEVLLNKERIFKAAARQHSFLSVGGFFGFLVWLLLFVNSLFGIAFLFTAFVSVRRNRTYPRELIHRVRQVLHDGELGFALEACVPSDTPLAHILFEGFKCIGDGFEACRDAMMIAVKAEKERLLKPVRALTTCAIFAIALGITGWVVSIVISVKRFAVNPEISNYQELAYAVGQSFYPLIVGILFACFAFFIFNYAVGKVNRIIVNTELLAFDLIKVLRGAHVEGEIPDIATMTQLLDFNTMANVPESRV